VIPEDLLEAIRASRRALCVSHVKPDGDAVGSLLGMTLILQGLGKQVTPALQDAPSAELLRLPSAGQIVHEQGLGHGYDTVVSVDASSMDRIGGVYRNEERNLPLLVIDHHITNTRFGAHNWIAATDAATSQMLVRLADALGVALTPDLAQCLLTGVVTDTLCFRTTNTTPDVLDTAMRLMQAGADLSEITENVFDQRPFSVLRLWGLVLDHARLEEGVIWATLPRLSLTMAGSLSDEDGSLSSVLIRTVGADMSATFLEKTDRLGAPAVECSFRARRGFDVSRIALQLGGGGHPQAGGCTVAGELDAVADHVVSLLITARREQRADRIDRKADSD
jgi:bifunctional oligoribonuclease and PAP phosphatase NrnA